MSFFLARVEPPGEETIRFISTCKVRLGGAEGPLARHILKLSQPEWQLDGTALAESLRPPEWSDSPVWLIWQSDRECPRKIRKITGLSTEFSTDVLVQMEFLEKISKDTYRPIGKFFGETLGLVGGRLTPQARWTWGAPKMAIGSVTLR